MGSIAPKLAELTDGVLYGDIWKRPQLKRDRSLVTVAALIALNRPDQLRSHLALARRTALPRRSSSGRSPIWHLRGLAEFRHGGLGRQEVSEELMTSCDDRKRE